MQVSTPVTDKCWSTSTAGATLLAYSTAPMAGHCDDTCYMTNKQKTNKKEEKY